MTTKINLKRALRLKRDIETRLKSHSVPTTGKISVLIKANQDDPGAAVGALRTKMAESLAFHDAISGALGYLRSMIIKSNVESGLEDLLSKIAISERRIEILKAMTAAATTPSLEEITSEIRLQTEYLNSENARSIYGRAEREIEVNLVSPQGRDELRQTLAKEKEDRDALEEQRVTKNLSTMIPIPEEMAELLRKNGLL